MAKRMAIRVKVFDICEYIEITEEMLTDSEKFMRHVLEKFGLDPSQAAQAYLFDQNNFRIPVDLYSVIMPQFLNSSVYIKLVFNLHENTGFDLTLADYLKQNGCKSIFLAAEQACKLGVELDSKSVHRLVDKAVHFMDYREEEGYKVDVQQVAESLVRLMPCIKMETLCSGTKGILRNKINYRKYKPSKKTTEQHYIDEPEPNGEVECMTEQINEMSVEDELTCLLFFKTCIIDRDKEILKIKMKQTIKLREKTIRKRDTKFVEVFPFYFVAPDLILFDYSIRFINEGFLLAKWEKLKMNIFAFLNQSDVEECANLGFDNDITAVLVLLRSLSMKKTFALNKVNTNPEDLIQKNYTYPYLIAVGVKKDEISNYYIDIEGHLIPVPDGFKGPDAIDMFFKCHKVFHIEYNPVFVKVMHFIDYYLFKDKENKEIDLTITMQKMSEKIQISNL